MQNTTSLKVGDQAPGFSLKNQAGKEISLKDFLNKQNVLLIFYPGDATPGCTMQLCAIRNDFKKFQDQNIAVFGVNHADEDSHQKFIDKNQFPFDLLIDTVVLINKKGEIIFLKKGTPSDAEILNALK